MNDKPYPSFFSASSCGVLGSMVESGGSSMEAMLFTCANIYVTALLAPTFDIGP